MMERSLNVPGSDSSALQIKYTGRFSSGLMKLHFKPHEKPAPPRPRNPEFLTLFTIFAPDVLKNQSMLPGMGRCSMPDFWGLISDKLCDGDAIYVFVQLLVHHA